MKLPSIEKNAFLSIYLSNQRIYANLAYVDYTSGRNYVLNDTTNLFGSLSLIYSTDFWKEYFSQLKEKFNWEILRGKEIINVVGEGTGVNAITVHINNNGINVNELVPAIRDVSYNISFQIISAEYVKTVLCGLSEKTSYEDIVYVNLDLFNFDVFRVLKKGGAKLLNAPHQSVYDFSQSSVNWSLKENLIGNIHNSKLKAFISQDISEGKLTNIWANYISNPSTTKVSAVLQDIIRSYITIQLLTILNDNQSKFEDIGTSKPSTLIVLSGGLIKTLDHQKLYISILDGLEVRGEVDLLIDEESKVLTFGRNLVEGVQSSEFIFSVNDIFTKMKRVYMADVASNSQRKVIFTGKVESGKLGEKEIYAFSPEITVIKLGNEKEFVSGRFVQGALWGEKYETFELFSDPNGITYSELVIDGRGKPVVYGPDSRTNRYKLSGWINENS